MAYAVCVAYAVCEIVGSGGIVRIYMHRTGAFARVRRATFPLDPPHLVMVAWLDNMALVWYDAIKIREVKRMTT